MYSSFFGPHPDISALQKSVLGSGSLPVEISTGLSLARFP
jgi:hypothetical protein